MATEEQVLVVCKSWEESVQAGPLRESIQQVCGSTCLPSVVIRAAKSGAEGAAFTVIGRAGAKERVICKADSANEAKEAFAESFSSPPPGPLKKVPSASKIEFETKHDRPGLLAAASALLKAHGVNIVCAQINTHDKGRRATHVYEVVDSKTGEEVSKTTFAGLKRGFEKLQEASPNPVDPISEKTPDSVDELRAQVVELTQKLEASRAENARLCIAIEEALAKK